MFLGQHMTSLGNGMENLLLNSVVVEISGDCTFFTIFYYLFFAVVIKSPMVVKQNIT